MLFEVHIPVVYEGNWLNVHLFMAADSPII